MTTQPNRLDGRGWDSGSCLRFLFLKTTFLKVVVFKKLGAVIAVEPNSFQEPGDTQGLRDVPLLVPSMHTPAQ